jgi:hypothetical protein
LAISRAANRVVSDVIVGDALNIAKPERQHWLRALQRLDLALLVDAQHHSVIGRIEIKSDDVPDLVDEQRIGGKLKALGAMRLNAEQGEHARHGALRQAGRLGGGSHRPVGSRRWFRLENRAKQVGDRCFVMGARSPRPSLAVKSGDPLIEPFVPPMADGGIGDPEPPRDRRVGFPVSGGQDDFRPANQPMGRRPRPRDPLQFVTLPIRERDYSFLRSPDARCHDPPRKARSKS